MVLIPQNKPSHKSAKATSQLRSALASLRRSSSGSWSWPCQHGAVRRRSAEGAVGKGAAVEHVNVYARDAAALQPDVQVLPLRGGGRPDRKLEAGPRKSPVDCA